MISLDLSTACTGWASYSSSGELLNYGRIVPDDKLHNFEKIKFIVDSLRAGLLEEKDLVIEGIFLNTFTGGFHNVTGFELLARLSGAVINCWLQNHDRIPVIYKATEARKLVGVKSSAQKAEIQIWVIKNFAVGTPGPDDLDDFDALIDATYAELNSKEITRPTFKTRMAKISRMIEEATGIGEDQADAILLGRAYFNDESHGKNTESIQ